MDEMSRERGDDHLTLSIDKMLKDFSHSPSTPSIYRVSDSLRSSNEKEYDPTIIAIGPFHHEKNHLKNMEHLKIRYLKLLLASRGESSVDGYVKEVRNLEERARKCYAEAITLGKEEFVKMLILDGVFIIEFLRECDKVYNGQRMSQDDPIFQFEHVVSHLLNDLILFENQIPFFVLEMLFNLSKINHEQEQISDLIRPLVSPSEIPKGISFPNADHLLGLVHHVKCSSFARIISCKRDFFVDVEHINSATELKEAGILFKKPKNKRTNNWLDIKFKNKKIHFPMLEIADGTECLFRNMIAYEYYLPRSHPRYVTDYTFFLHCLIHSPKDAELLRRCGIISNWLGGDEMVYHLINRLGTNVQTSDNFSYLDVFRSINHHCEQRRNLWIAVLWRDHLNSPWRVISVVAAFVLLVVTIAQTVFAILSYYHDLKR